MVPTVDVSVRVCAELDTVIPCTPLTLYDNSALTGTPLPNPLTTDSTGSYAYCVASGITVNEQFSGANISTLNNKPVTMGGSSAPAWASPSADLGTTTPRAAFLTALNGVLTPRDSTNNPKFQLTNGLAPDATFNGIRSLPGGGLGFETPLFAVGCGWSDRTYHHNCGQINARMTGTHGNYTQNTGGVFSSLEGPLSFVEGTTDSFEQYTAISGPGLDLHSFAGMMTSINPGNAFGDAQGSLGNLYSFRAMMGDASGTGTRVWPATGLTVDNAYSGYFDAPPFAWSQVTGEQFALFANGAHIVTNATGPVNGSWFTLSDLSWAHKKHFRVQSNSDLELMNSAGDTVLLTVTDAAAISTPGTITAATSTTGTATVTVKVKTPLLEGAAGLPISVRGGAGSTWDFNVKDVVGTTNLFVVEDTGRTTTKANMLDDGIGHAEFTGQLTSTVATGTAPFVVASTTPVVNLSIGGNAATATAATTATTATTAASLAATPGGATGSNIAVCWKAAGVLGYGTIAEVTAGTCH